LQFSATLINLAQNGQIFYENHAHKVDLRFVNLYNVQALTGKPKTHSNQTSGDFHPNPLTITWGDFHLNSH